MFEDLVHRVQLILVDLDILGARLLSAVEDNAVISIFPTGVVGSLVPANTPGPIVEEVDRVADIVPEMTYHVDEDHKALDQGMDQRFFQSHLFVRQFPLFR